MSSHAAQNQPDMADPQGFSARWEADRIGVILSIACAVHCMATPFILLLLPAMGEVWSHPAAHWGMALLIVPIALILTIKGYRRHGRTWILFTCILGVLFILGGAAAPHIQHQLAAQEQVEHTHVHEDGVTHSGNCCPTLESAKDGSTHYQVTVGSVLTTLGGLLLIATHIGNLRSCSCCKLEGHDHVHDHE